VARPLLTIAQRLQLGPVSMPIFSSASKLPFVGTSKCSQILGSMFGKILGTWGVRQHPACYLLNPPAELGITLWEPASLLA
jgi:hypothetical protein